MSDSLPLQSERFCGQLKRTIALVAPGSWGKNADRLQGWCVNDYGTEKIDFPVRE
jgi:hypothetical protein